MINAISRLYFMEVGDLDIQKKVYEAEDIQKLLGLVRSKTYLFLEQVYEKQEPFRVIKIGKLCRVPKKSFDDWLNGNE